MVTISVITISWLPPPPQEDKKNASANTYDCTSTVSDVRDSLKAIFFYISKPSCVYD